MNKYSVNGFICIDEEDLEVVYGKQPLEAFRRRARHRNRSQLVVLRGVCRNRNSRRAGTEGRLVEGQVRLD